MEEEGELGEENRRESYNDINEERNSAGVREDRSQREEDSPPNDIEPSQPSDTIRLLFPRECNLNVQEKVLWTVRLARAHRAFSAVLKDGRSCPYVTVKTQEAADFLIEEGYEGLKLLAPERFEKTTKIIIFRYPEYLDVDFVLDDPRIEWARRNRVRGETRCQVIALIKGDAPRRIYVNGLGFRPVAQYKEEPRFCLRCSRWGHDSWTCQSDPRCRFCGRPHLSSVCGNKIRQQTRITPRCANCRGEHNARSTACPAHPYSRLTQRDSPPPPPAGQTPQRPGVIRPAPPPSVNAWGQGRPLMPGDQQPTTTTENGGGASGGPDPSPGPSLTHARTHDVPTPSEDGGSAAASAATSAVITEGNKCGCTVAQENSVLLQMMTKMFQKIEGLEEKIKVLEMPDTNKNKNKNEERKNEKKSEEVSQRKVVISGKEKVFKHHKMLNGLEVVEKAIKKCGNDDAKKSKIFKGWVEAHKTFDRIMNEMENIAGSPMDSSSK